MIVKQKSSRRQFLRTFALAAVGAVAAACEPQSVVVKETIEVETAVTKVVEKVVAPTATAPGSGGLRVSMAAFGDALPAARGALEQAFIQAEKDLSAAIRWDTRNLPGVLGANCYGVAGLNIGDYDLFMLDSPSVPDAIRDGRPELDPVPPEMLDSIESFAPGNVAFTGGDRSVFGLTLGTSPVLTIYRPDVLGDLGEELAWGDMLDLASEFGLRMPAHSCMVVATLHSLEGNEFNEDTIFRGLFRGRLGEYQSTLDDLQALENIKADVASEIVDDFTGEGVLVLHSSDFLVRLAESGYDGPVATTRFPMINHQGGSAHCLGWVVPNEAENRERAWALAEWMAGNATMVRWGLANGLVPASQRGWDMLLEDPMLAEGLLPLSLFESDGYMGLWNSAREAPCWHIPEYVSADRYNRVFLPTGNDIVAAMINEKIPLDEAAERLLVAAAEIDLPYD
jgi:ABC-type glycerol-3-phosphate transport system substrate-binding protein